VVINHAVSDSFFKKNLNTLNIRYLIVFEYLQ